MCFSGHWKTARVQGVHAPADIGHFQLLARVGDSGEEIDAEYEGEGTPQNPFGHFFGAFPGRRLLIVYLKLFRVHRDAEICENLQDIRLTYAVVSVE